MKFGVKLYPTLLGLSDKTMWKLFFLTSEERYEEEKFDSRLIFYVLDVNLVIAQGAYAL